MWCNYGTVDVRRHYRLSYARSWLQHVDDVTTYYGMAPSAPELSSPVLALVPDWLAPISTCWSR